MKVYTLLLGLLLLSSCLPYVVNHDVIYAPKVLLSPDVDTLLIVNNTGYQGPHKGHKYQFMDRAGLLLQRTDTFNNEFLTALSSSFRKMGIVTLLEEESIRTDSAYLRISKLDSLRVHCLNKKHRADFALVLDQGAVSSDLNVTRLRDTTALYFNYILSYATRFHVHDMLHDIELAEVNEQTATSWETLNTSFTKGVNSLAFDESMRQREVERMTDQVMKSFFPYSVTHERRIFYSGNMNLKDALQYVKKGRWEESFVIWSYMYNKSQKSTIRLYSALNLAFYFERVNMLSQTYYWLKLAQRISGGVPADVEEYITVYLQSVEKRLQELSPQVVGYY